MYNLGFKVEVGRQMLNPTLALHGKLGVRPFVLPKGITFRVFRNGG